MERITGIKWLPALTMVCLFSLPCANAQTSQAAPAEGSAAAQQAPTPTGQQMTNAMYKVNAKGILMQGRSRQTQPPARSAIRHRQRGKNPMRIQGVSASYTKALRGFIYAGGK